MAERLRIALNFQVQAESRAGGKEEILTKVWLTHMLFLLMSGDKSPVSHLQGEGWEFGGSAPGLIMDKQGGLFVSLI